MACEACGKNAPTKEVRFMANIGLIFFRFETGEEGRMCKSCIHGSFFKHQAICMFLGWWGIISFFFNIFFVFSNLLEWIFALGMKSGNSAPSSRAPSNSAVDQAIKPFASEIRQRLRRGEKVGQVSASIAQLSGLNQRDVLQFITKHYQKLTQ